MVVKYIILNPTNFTKVSKAPFYKSCIITNIVFLEGSDCVISIFFDNNILQRDQMFAECKYFLVSVIFKLIKTNLIIKKYSVNFFSFSLIKK
jgi:hypothetical protein